MSSPTGPLVNEVLAGLVERVTFHNSDTGFCVLRIKARHLDFFVWKDFPVIYDGRDEKTPEAW